MDVESQGSRNVRDHHELAVFVDRGGAIGISIRGWSHR